MRKPTPDRLRARAVTYIRAARAHEKRAKEHERRAALWRAKSREWRKLAEADTTYANHLERLPAHLRPDWLAHLDNPET